MIRERKIVLITFAVTAGVCLTYCAGGFLWQNPEVYESPGVWLAVFVISCSLLFFCESIVFAIIFRKHFRKLALLLTTAFALTSCVPAYLFMTWLKAGPAGSSAAVLKKNSR